MIITIQSHFLLLIHELQDFSKGTVLFCHKFWCAHTLYVYTHLFIGFISSSSHHNLIIQHYGNVYTEPFTKRP